jgi:hypothetical protein
VYSLATRDRLACAHAAFAGPYGAVTRLARDRGSSRQALYRQAHAAAQAIEGTQAERRLADLRQRLADAQARLTDAQARRRQAVVVDADRQAQFAATAQALGVSLSATRALLAVLLGADAPSTAQLGRFTRQAGRQAGAVLAVLDPLSGARARQVAADEIFSGKRPILMTVEQHSLCWLGGRLAPSREGVEWAKEFRRLSAAEQVTSDRGQGLHKGLAFVNAERRQNQRPALADQSDHFHPVRRGQQALRQRRHEAERALQAAVRAQRAYDAAGRRGTPRTAAQGRALNLAWEQAEAAFDRWGAYERALGRLRVGLRLFTAEGELNTPERGAAEVQAALGAMAGPGLAKVQRGVGAEAFTFLRRTQAALAALPVAPELVRAAVRVEGLGQRPEALQGEGPQARALRGVLLAATLVLTLAQEAGQRARALVRGVLAGAWRASSLVEGLNSVVRMHQGRQKRLTQGLLDLKRLYWNVHTFRAGKRKQSSRYGRLGVVLPEGSWWDLLQRSPEQLQHELSALNPTA